MSAYVCVRKHDELRRLIDLAGTQTDVAAAAGLSVQRVNQLYVGTHHRLEVRKARRLEDVLRVPHGTCFTAVDGPLLLPYVAGNENNPAPADADADDAADADADDETHRVAAGSAAPAA